MKILIVGDSFAVNFLKFYQISYPGWVNMLSDQYSVTNLAQAGVGQYKILKQIESADLGEFDKIIVSVSSPYRLHCTKHPLHLKGMHSDCDLIFSDVNRFNLFNRKISTAKNWFKYYFDEKYAIDIYQLISEQMLRILKDRDFLILNHTNTRLMYLKNNANFLDFSSFWKENRGFVNHYTAYGNKVVFEKVQELLQCT